MESRAYRFISDPDHKENLSGRVRAACLTCRRKKIKCDGEVPCQTCKEKGVLCEGLTERKRPVKSGERQRPLDDGWSIAADPLPTAKRKPSYDSQQTRGIVANTTASAKRPEIIRVDTISSDSSASSGRQSRPNEWTEITDAYQQTSHTSAGPFGNHANISAFNTNDVDWSFRSAQNMHDYSGSDMLNRDRSFAQQVSANSPEWQDRVDSVSWPSETYHTQDASELISAAKMLEAHAQSLRWLASEQHAQNFDDARRQTSTLPLESNLYTDFNSLPANSGGAYEGIPNDNSGYTSPLCDCSAWMNGGQCPHWQAPGRSNS